MEMNQLITVNAILFIVWFVTTIKFYMMKDTYDEIIELCAEKDMKIIELGEIIETKRELYKDNELTNARLYDTIDELKSQLVSKMQIIDELENKVDGHKYELFNANYDYKGR